MMSSTITTATLEASGVTVESAITQTVVIPSGERARVEWDVTVLDVPAVDLTFYAIGQDGAQDAVKPTLATGPNGTIPVYRYTAPDTVGTGGVLRGEGARTEAISLPPRVDTDRGELTIKIEPSLAATSSAAFTSFAVRFSFDTIHRSARSSASERLWASTAAPSLLSRQNRVAFQILLAKFR